MEYAPYKSNCNCNGSLSQDTTGMTPREKYFRRVFGSQVPRNSVIYSAPYLSGEYLRSLLSQHPTNNLGKNLFLCLIDCEFYLQYIMFNTATQLDSSYVVQASAGVIQRPRSIRA